MNITNGKLAAIAAMAVASGGCWVNHHPDARTNLQVTIGTVNPPTVAAGSQVSATVTVTESGGQPTGSYSLSLYLSTNSTITHGFDTELLYILMPSLAGGGEVAQDLDVTIPDGLPGGTYFLGAIVDVDDDVFEVWEGDNTHSVVLTVTNSGDVCVTTHEPDNTLSQAESRGEFVEQTSFFGCCAAGDPDVLWIIVDPGFERVTVSLYFTHANGDLDLELVDAGGIVLASSASGTDNEFLNHVVPFAGEYYIRVKHFTASGFNDYETVWDDTTP